MRGEYQSQEEVLVSHIHNVEREPFIFLEIGGVSVSALVDTGSAVTLIKESMFKNISTDMIFKKSSHPKVYDASGGIVQCLGSYFVRAKLQGREIAVPVLVVSDDMRFKQCILLGMAFMKEYNIN